MELLCFDPSSSPSTSTSCVCSTKIDLQGRMCAKWAIWGSGPFCFDIAFGKGSKTLVTEGTPWTQRTGFFQEKSSEKARYPPLPSNWPARGTWSRGEGGKDKMALTVENDAYMRDMRQRALALDSIPVTRVSDVMGETELPPPSLPHFIFTAVVTTIWTGGKTCRGQGWKSTGGSPCSLPGGTGCHLYPLGCCNCCFLVCCLRCQPQYLKIK